MPYKETTFQIRANKFNQLKLNSQKKQTLETRLAKIFYGNNSKNILTCSICGDQLVSKKRMQHIADYHPNLRNSLNEANLVYNIFKD